MCFYCVLQIYKNYQMKLNVNDNGREVDYNSGA